MRAERRPVAIVGAGLAGLTAAAALRRRGVPVRLFEAGRQIAGLASSFTDEDGFSYDFGAHFITNRLAAALGVGSQCRDVRYYGETVLLNRRTYSYPFGLARSPRMMTSAVAARSRALWRQAPPQSAADWFAAEYGEVLARKVAIPLVEAWSGAPAVELAASVGQKFSRGIARTLFLKLASRVTKRAIANGYCREQAESVHVWHVYPEGGVSLLCRQLAKGLDSVLHLQSPVEAIIVDSGRAVGVRVNGREEEVAAVMSTAPVHILAQLVQGTDAVQHLRRFRYRPMVFVNLRLQGRNLLPDVVTWTPEQHFPFFRITEAPRSMPWLAPPGKTLLTVDIGCEVNDDLWRMPDEKLGDLCIEHLAALLPDARTRYLGCRVLRTPIAYPVFLRAYEQERMDLERSTGVPGLYSIGRNGEFAHILMEDVYWRTLRRVREFLMDGAVPVRSPQANLSGLPAPSIAEN